MTTLGTIFFIIAFIVAAKLLLRILYFWKTGKAGLEDPAFEYLKDIWRWIRGA